MLSDDLQSNAGASTHPIHVLADNSPQSAPCIPSSHPWPRVCPRGGYAQDRPAGRRGRPPQAGPHGGSAAINETRQALGQLLEKTRNLGNAQRRMLPDIASETTSALEMGVTVAAGTLTGGVMAVIGAAAIPATVASGGLAAAPMLILGGIHWWRRNKDRLTPRDFHLKLS